MAKEQKVFLIHGIRSKDKGAASMGSLAKMIAKTFPFVKRVNYGYVLIPINNKKAVTALIEELQNHDTKTCDVVVIAYSNGCWATVQVAEMGYKIDHMVLISPALHKSHAIPEQVKRVDIYYSSGDDIVSLGKVYSTLANILPWNWKGFGDPHDWGAMGKYGYVGNDPRIHNWEMGSYVSHFWYRYKTIVSGITKHLNIIYKKEES